MKTTQPSRWWKWFKRLAFVVAVLVTLIALALAIEGYRGKRAWEACVRQLEAQGETVDWRTLAPRPVPNDQNMLAAPLLAPCFGFDAALANSAAETNPCQQLERRFRWTSDLKGAGDRQRGRLTSLEAWQKQLRSDRPAEDVSRLLAQRYGLGTNEVKAIPDAVQDPALVALQARPSGTALEDLRFLLEQDREPLDELRAAAGRPFAQMRLDPDAFLKGTFMGQFATLKGLARWLQVSAWTALGGGEPAAALKDIEAMLKLGGAAGSQPLLISHLLQLSITDSALNTVWAGLAEHRWGDAQLAGLERELGQLNLVAEAQRSLRGERVFSLAALGALPDQGLPVSFLEEAHWPAAMIHRNRINVARAIQVLLIDRLDPAGPGVRLSESAGDEVVRKRFMARTPYNLFTAMLLPALDRTLDKTARVQAAVSFARLACALERYRLANGGYPERLDELAPRFLDRLPPDPVEGGPIGYRRETPAGFELVSAGRDDKGGEWVWRSGPR